MTVETDVTKRWEQGVKHDPRSEKFVRSVADLDFKYGGNFFCFKVGENGDNGEHLMYLLDIYYELKEEEQKRKHEESKAKQLKSCIDLTRALDKPPSLKN